MALLLKLDSPTPSNTGLPRSFQRNTERFYGTEKFNAEEVQKSAYEQPKHNNVRRSLTYGKNNAPYQGYIEFNLK